MRNSVLAVVIAFVLAAPCTALAGDQKKTIDVQSWSFGGTNPSTQTGPPKTKASTTTPAGTTGITPGWNTCTSDACPGIRSNPLGKSSGASGVVAGTKAKLPR
jgi:hypothetical protein